MYGVCAGWFKQIAPFFLSATNADHNIYSIECLIFDPSRYHTDRNKQRKRVTKPVFMLSAIYVPTNHRP